MPELLSHLHDQIQMVAKHEQEFLTRRTRSEKIGDSLGTFIGSLTFVAIHLVWFAAWICINVLPLSVRHFDPPPFSLLNSIVAIEAIFLASFILMRQSRTSRRADERDHLTLQLLLLTEKEITAVLNVERKLAQRMGLKEVAEDSGIEELSRETPIDDMAQSLAEHLSDEGRGAE